MRGAADPPLRRGQPKGGPHRPVEERVGAGRGRPDALVEAAQNDAIGRQQPGFEKAQDLDPRMAAVGAAHRGFGGEAVEQGAIAGAIEPDGGVGSSVEFLEQPRERREAEPARGDLTGLVAQQSRQRRFMGGEPCRQGCGGAERPQGRQGGQDVLHERSRVRRSPPRASSASDAGACGCVALCRARARVRPGRAARAAAARRAAPRFRAGAPGARPRPAAGRGAGPDGAAGPGSRPGRGRAARNRSPAGPGRRPASGRAARRSNSSMSIAPAGQFLAHPAREFAIRGHQRGRAGPFEHLAQRNRDGQRFLAFVGGLDQGHALERKAAVEIQRRRQRSVEFGGPQRLADQPAARRLGGRNGADSRSPLALDPDGARAGCAARPAHARRPVPVLRPRHRRRSWPRTRRSSRRSRPGRTTAPCGSRATAAISRAVALLVPVEPATTTGPVLAPAGKPRHLGLDQAGPAASRGRPRRVPPGSADIARSRCRGSRA